MVLAEFTMDADNYEASLHVKGHAGANRVGDDIVCASASILAYTLAQNMKGCLNGKMLRRNPRLKLKTGDAIITAHAKDVQSYEKIMTIYCTIQAGYQLLAHNYPQYVQVKMFGQDDAPEA